MVRLLLTSALLLTLTSISTAATPVYPDEWEGDASWTAVIGQGPGTPKPQFDGSTLTQSRVEDWVDNEGDTLKGWGTFRVDRGSGNEVVDRYMWFTVERGMNADELIVLTDRHFDGATDDYDSHDAIARLHPADDSGSYPAISNPASKMLPHIGVYIDDLEYTWDKGGADEMQAIADEINEDYYGESLPAPDSTVMAFAYFKTAAQRDDYIADHVWDDSDQHRVAGSSEPVTMGMVTGLFGLWCLACTDCQVVRDGACPRNKVTACTNNTPEGKYHCGKCDRNSECAWTCKYQDTPCPANPIFPSEVQSL